MEGIENRISSSPHCEYLVLPKSISRGGPRRPETLTLPGGRVVFWIAQVEGKSPGTLDKGDNYWYHLWVVKSQRRRFGQKVSVHINYCGAAA